MRFNPEETQRRIIDAGLHLFYSASIAEVGVDQIAAKAGITKKTLYYHFPSKEILISACYDMRATVTLERYKAWAGDAGTAAERFARLFQGVREYVATPAFHGCGFMRAASELASRRDHPACEIIARYKRDMEAWFGAMLAAEGYVDAPGLARRAMILLDGCLAHVMFHRDPAYADEASSAFQAILATAPRA